MRLVTWNCCRGPYLKKAPLLDALAPDIAVIQECARPTTETDQCLWFGDNPHQGIAVFTKGSYRIRALPILPEVPKYAIPVEVLGPTNFLLIAVWSKGGQASPYVEGVVRAVELIVTCSLETAQFFSMISTLTPSGIPPRPQT